MKSPSDYEIELSVAIITYNEEKQIGDCIATVHDWCDEVVVLDSFSNDRTRQIAESFSKVRFDTHDFDGHVQQKNRAINYSRGRWILCMDADERVTPQLAQSIREFITLQPEADGARILRLTRHLDRFIRHSGWYNARYRLIRRGRGAWGGENPHDQIILKGREGWNKNQGTILKGDLIHYSFTDLSDQINTINKFSSITAFTRAGRQDRRFSIFWMLAKPVSKFLEIYLFKRGFLDGIPGLIIAISSAFSTFLKWAKLYELQRSSLERPSNLRADYQVQSTGDGRRP